MAADSKIGIREDFSHVFDFDQLCLVGTDLRPRPPVDLSPAKNHQIHRLLIRPFLCRLSLHQHRLRPHARSLTNLDRRTSPEGIGSFSGSGSQLVGQHGGLVVAELEEFEASLFFHFLLP